MLKVKVHTLDIAPPRSESSPQKRSGMARVLKGFHSFTCTPTSSSPIGMSHTCLCLPSRSPSCDRPRRDGRLSRPWCEVSQAEIRTRNLPIVNPALYHTATSAPGWWWWRWRWRRWWWWWWCNFYSAAWLQRQRWWKKGNSGEIYSFLFLETGHL